MFASLNRSILHSIPLCRNQWGFYFWKLTAAVYYVAIYECYYFLSVPETQFLWRMININKSNNLTLQDRHKSYRKISV